MRQLSKEVISIIETRNKEAFGVTVKELKEIVSNSQKKTEQALREKEQMSREKEQILKELEEQEKKLNKSEMFQIGAIKRLHTKAKMGAEEISNMLSLDLAFIKKVIEQNDKTMRQLSKEVITIIKSLKR